MDTPYSDVTTPLRFIEGAREGLAALKRAGHVIVLYSTRANRSGLESPTLDPLVRAGIKRVHQAAWERSQPLEHARLAQMLEFARTELHGLIDVVDDGQQGKPRADVFIDDRAIALGASVGTVGWNEIARRFGEREGVSYVHTARYSESYRRGEVP